MDQAIEWVCKFSVSRVEGGPVRGSVTSAPHRLFALAALKAAAHEVGLVLEGGFKGRDRRPGEG